MFKNYYTFSGQPKHKSKSLAAATAPADAAAKHMLFSQPLTDQNDIILTYNRTGNDYYLLTDLNMHSTKNK